MSSSSLNSSNCEGTGSGNIFTGGFSYNPINKETIDFDKCPHCKIQYDFIKRGNNASSKVPLILNCQHTVCEDCIRRICHSNSPICPVCQEKIVVPRAQIDALPDLFTPHFALIGYLMWSKNASNKKQINLVSTGLTLKSKQMSGLESVTTDFSSEFDDKSEDENTDNDSDKITSSVEFNQCSEHNSPLNILCENCSDVVCCYCFVEYHPGHKPKYLYKLNDDEVPEMMKYKSQALKILRQLQISQKKVKELKKFDCTHVDTEIRNCFSNLYAKLHLAERNIRKKLTTIKADDSDLEMVSYTLKSGIAKVKQILHLCNMLNIKQINIRALYEELQDLVNLPCRLVSDQGTLEPIEFLCKDELDNVEQYFSLKKTSCLEYNLLTIEDWNDLDGECDTNVDEIKIRISTPTMKPEVTPPSSTITSKDSSHSTTKIKTTPSTSGGGRMKIILTHLNDLNSFYVQRCSVQDSLKKMNQFIGNKIKRKLTSNDVIIGRVYGVLYETKKSSCWRRGQLTEIIKKDGGFLYNVFFIDYGNTKLVTIDNLKELDYSVIKRTPFALHCKLTNPNDIIYDANVHLQLPQIIGKNELYIQYIKKDYDDVEEVDLFIPSSKGYFVSVREILFETPTMDIEEPLLSNNIKLFKNSKKFEVGQEEQVIVTHISDPFNFYIQLVSNVGSLDKMKYDMKVFYENQNASCIPVEDSDAVIFYQHPKQGDWHRGRIISVNNTSKNVDVFFVDWGGRDIVPWSSVKSITENFMKIECQAIAVKLAHVEQDPNKQCSAEVREFLNQQLSTEVSCKMVVSNEDPLEVALFQCRPAADICLNSLLVKHNYAVSSGIISETLYWPNQQVVEEMENDNDLSFQLIKKSEEVIAESEDLELKTGIKQQISVIHFESPNLIYIKFTKYKEKEEELQKELQIHYSTSRKTKESWKPSDYCIVYDSIKKRYLRAIIKSRVGSESYSVYLYDEVRDLIVPKKDIFIQDRYFKRFACYTCKCRLAKIIPAGGTGEWSKLAIEILAKIFSTYKTLHIKKIETNRDEKIVGVIMWYSLITPAKALEPSRSSLISINKTLIESGVAFSAPLADIEQGSPKMINSFEKECEEIDDAVSDDSSIPEDKENKNSKEDGKNSKVDWYDMICEDEDMLKTPLATWPKHLPLQKAEFDAVLTCIDSEGCFSVRDEEVQSLYLEMEKNLNTKFKTLKRSKDTLQWRPGEMCTISYEDDWYRGTVVEVINPEEITVEMIDFGSAHTVSPKDLYKYIMYPDMPPLINKIQLYDVSSKYGQFSAEDVDELLKIVSDNIKVIVKSDLDVEVPLAEIYLPSGLSVNDLITQKCPHLVRFTSRVALGHFEDENNTNYYDEEDDPQYVEHDNCVETEKSELENNDDDDDDILLTYTYAPIPKRSHGKCKMSVVNVIKLDLKYNVVLNVLNNEISTQSEDFKTLNNEIQKLVKKQPGLDKIETYEPCICLNTQNQSWCRGIIYNTESLDFGYVLVFFVDYGTVDMVDVQNIKVMRPEWFNLPVYNRIATINIELNQKNRSEHVLMQLSNLRGKSVSVGIVSEDPLTVHLYEGKKLCYQNFINCGIVSAL